MSLSKRHYVAIAHIIAFSCTDEKVIEEVAACIREVMGESEHLYGYRQDNTAHDVAATVLKNFSLTLTKEFAYWLVSDNDAFNGKTFGAAVPNNVRRYSDG